MTEAVDKRTSRVRNNYYAVATGHTVRNFTSWSICKQSVNSYHGQLYKVKGFPDIESAINFMIPFDYNCRTVTVYGDLGNPKSARLQPSM